MGDVLVVRDFLSLVNVNLLCAANGIVEIFIVEHVKKGFVSKKGKRL